MNQQDFETEKYRFWFHTIGRLDIGKLGVVREDVESVGVGVKYLERHTERHIKIEEAKEFLKDMGKWETVIEAGKCILEDLGIIKKTETENKNYFGFEKYEMKFSKEGNGIYVIIKLTQEESLRRTKGNSKLLKPSEKEIAEQLKNIPKWQKLKSAILEVNTLRELLQC